MATVTNFVSTSDTVLQTLMTSLEPKLGLPAGTFAALHLEGNLSGSEARTIFKPALGEGGHLEGTDENGKPAAAIGVSFEFFLSTFIRNFSPSKVRS